MKKLFHLILISLFAFSLTACISGGGGGGSSSGIGGGVGNKGPLSPFAGGATEIRKANSLSDAIGVGPAAGLTMAQQTGNRTSDLYVNSMRDIGISLQMGTSLVIPHWILKVEGDMLILVTPWGSPIRVLSSNDFTVLDNGIVGSTFSGSAYALDNRVMVLGGKSVGLEYTNFGYWMRIRERADYLENANPHAYFAPFILESTIAVKKEPPSTGAFAGTVIALPYDGYTTTPQYLVGQADLVLSSATAGNLTFTFPNFYTLNTGLNIDGSGGITQDGGFILSDSAKNSTGINLLSGGSGSVTGQFYGGSTPGYATEAVGRFDYNNSSSRGVRGSFGVK